MKSQKNLRNLNNMKIQLSEHFTYRKLIKFTLPTVIMMIFSSIYGVIDGIFVSNFVSNEAFASVNIILPAIMLFGAIGFMIGTGGSALVSKTLGEGENKKANQYFSMLHYLLIILGFLSTILGFVFMEKIACLLGAEETMINDCVIYGRILILFIIPCLLQYSFQSFLVVAEKPTFGLIIMIIAGITNMVLDFLFIYVLNMGILGAGLATGISQVVGGIIPFIYFIFPNNTPLKLLKTKFDWKAIKKSCINGSSEMVTNLSISIINILYNLQLMKYIGTDGVVAYGIIMYTSFIFSGTYFGYAVGSTPIIAYHYGANNKDELKSLLKKSLKLVITTSIVITILSEVTSKLVSTIFVSSDLELLELTTRAIQLYSISHLISGINIFASSFFTALNNGFVSATISFLRTLLFQVAMIFLLPILLGIDGLWIAIVVAEFLTLLISIMFTIKNNKKYQYF